MIFSFSRGDILVFLTGQDEIESLAKLVMDCAQHCGSGELNLQPNKSSYLFHGRSSGILWSNGGVEHF